MRGWRVVLSSVVVHASTFAVFATWHRATRVAATAVVPVVPVGAIDPVAIPPELIEISLLDDPPAINRLPGTRRDALASAPRPARPARTVAQVAAVETAPSAGSVETSVPKRGLGMRGLALHPSDAALEHIADVPVHVGTTPQSTVTIDSAPNGRRAMHVPGTTLVVERDGTAHFTDDPDIDAAFKLTPTALGLEASALKSQVKEWLADPDAFKRAGRTQDLPNTLRAVEGGCNWGDAMCDATDTETHQKPWRDTHGFTRIPILGGNLDITSYLMRKFNVGDPLASKKLELLDATRDQRAARGAIYEQAQLDRSAVMIQQNLVRLWANSQNVDERRAVLFELWDECAEGDSPIGIAGERARALVVGWIRSHLPAGQPGAFTSAELGTLDQHRASHEHFAPY
jgi:hypothetical protein